MLGMQDGQNVTYAGIISSIKKKYTKNNKLMAFVTVDDLYGSAEIIVFESCYQTCANALLNDNIVLVEGRLSIREDEEPKIVAKTIKEFTDIKNEINSTENTNNLKEVKKKIFTLDITNLDELTREKLKGAIYFFKGEKNNIQMQIVNGEKKDLVRGGIYLNSEILTQFQELVGQENARVEEC